MFQLIFCNRGGGAPGEEEGFWKVRLSREMRHLPRRQTSVPRQMSSTDTISVTIPVRDKQLARAALRRKCPTEKVVFRGQTLSPCGRRARARKAGEGKEAAWLRAGDRSHRAQCHRCHEREMCERWHMRGERFCEKERKKKQQNERSWWCECLALSLVSKWGVF